MAVLVIVNTLFWSGLVPFPISTKYEAKPENLNAAPCLKAHTKPVKREEITVRVYNDGEIDGLASKVATKLKKQKVKVAVTANWTGSIKTEGDTIIITGKKTLDKAYTLRALFPTATIKYNPLMETDVVDIVLGNNEQPMNISPTKEDYKKAMKSFTECRKI